MTESRLVAVWTAAFLLVIPVHGALAQGQDSTPVLRDRQVISTLLPGVWNNNNQSYFDQRIGVADSDTHDRLHVEIERADAANDRFAMNLTWGQDDAPATEWTLELAEGDGVVEMTLRKSAAKASDDACVVLWRREAAQFRGTAVGGAGCTNLPGAWLLSEQQLWLTPLTAPDRQPPVSAYKLHRTRAFKCYVDIPGVAGGRDEPYERYGEFDTHDGGGLIRIQTRDDPSRELGVSLWRVDWPINNYEGVFTRDVLVIVVIEFMPDGSVTQHGYSFTEPDVARVGVNLIWMLASCYIQSNAEQTPFM